MNKQEIFNKVYTHLLQQNQKAVNEFNSCTYRMADGLKCAAGCLIPDHLYDPKMEGLAIGRLLQDYPDLNIALGIEQNDLVAVQFLTALQKVHDNVEVSYWPQSLQEVANKYLLSIPS